jgi:hypothetical protein
MMIGIYEPSNGYWAFLLREIREPLSEAYYSPTYSGEIKNVWWSRTDTNFH